MSVLKDLSNAMADVVETAAKGIVRVEARKRLPATGIIWAENVIVTAHHVIEKSDGLKVGLADGRVVEATLIGRDPNTDVAVLRAEVGHPALPHAGEGLRIGHLVLALGRPGQDVQATLGVVSAIGANEPEDEDNDWNKRAQKRAERMAERAARRWGSSNAYAFAYSTGSSGIRAEGAIQTDVVMYPGFSGGPLVDAAGIVRGMNTSALARGTSIAVAVPTIERIVNTLLQHGRMRRGFLGIGAQPVRLQEAIANEIGQETGLLLVQIESGGPAEQAGLYVGDIIVALDQQAVRHLDELLALLNGDRVGKTVKAHIVRGGKVEQIDITVGEKM
ncbi:MAG: S1C family serine protease [Anaerolineae bacterium]|jgi:S1-C subfamily serine protease|nr:S1C family serine protease [Anaerolineae bacterium]